LVHKISDLVHKISDLVHKDIDRCTKSEYTAIVRTQQEVNMANEIVKYNNKMNDIPLNGFNQRDLNFFYTLCAKLKDKDTDVITITFDEIKQLSGYTATSTETFIKDLERMNLKLLTCHGRIETDEVISSFVLFTTFSIYRQEQILKVSVNHDYSYLLNHLAKEFTMFELQQYVSCSSTYSKGIFRLLKQWKSVGSTPIYRVEELKMLLDTPTDYKPKRLMQAIIEPAIKELQTKKVWSNLWVEVIYKRGRGKPVDGYRFHFADNTLKGQMTLDNYIDEKPKSKRKNKFNDYENKQNYNIDELEKEILANK
jgi:plasmid replication initiation protein